MRDHGTHACYVHGPNPGSTPGGCRCEPCRVAHAAYEKERASRVAPSLVDADPVRDHLEVLAAAGVGLKQVAKVSGVAHGALWKIVYGVPSKDRPPSRRVRPETAAAILAVKPSDGADGSRVPAGPTHRHVATLVDRGWSKVAIARAVGQTGPGLQIGKKYVTRRVARIIEGLLDQPVQTKRGRTGVQLPAAWDVAEAARDDARRSAEREKRARHRAQERGDDVDQVAPDFELPSIAPGTLDQAWRKRAVCRKMDPADKRIFFATDRPSVAAAKKVCSACPVAAQCRAAAAGEVGTWGGVAESERLPSLAASA